MNYKLILRSQVIIIGIIVADFFLNVILNLTYTLSFPSPEKAAATLADSPFPNILFKSFSVIFAASIVNWYRKKINEKLVWVIKKQQLRYLLIALLAPLLIIIFVISIGSDFSIQRADITSYTPFFYMILMFLVALHEEILFRYIPLLTGNHWYAYLLSSILFVLVHVFNSSDLIFLTNVFLFSLLISYGTWITKNIFFAFVPHFIWNCFTGPILGLSVSGRKMESWFLTDISFVGYYDEKVGLESSVILTALFFLIILSIVVFHFLSHKRSKSIK